PFLSISWQAPAAVQDASCVTAPSGSVDLHLVFVRILWSAARFDDVCSHYLLYIDHLRAFHSSIHASGGTAAVQGLRLSRTPGCIHPDGSVYRSRIIAI